MPAHLFLAPDATPEGVKVSLSKSLCPSDAVVKADETTGYVSITTTGPWRADKRGYEEGLGVDGWAYVETVDVPTRATEAAKYTVDTKAAIALDGKAQVLSGGKAAVTLLRHATPPVGLLLALALALLYVFFPPTITTYKEISAPPEVDVARVLDAWRSDGYAVVTRSGSGMIDILIDPELLDTISDDGRRVDGYSQVIDGSCVVHVRDPDPLTVAHEVGHCIGLEHSWRTGTIMHASDRGWKP